MARPTTPAEAWAELAAGNDRFIAGDREHPHQDVHDREALADGQAPFAVFFGCADSRVAAEIIFDQGLGDLFVVRTAGHVVDPAVLGSLEFGVGVLGAPLIVVLGHDSCGAVKATIDAEATGDLPPGFLRDIVERVMPSVLTSHREGDAEPDDVMRRHVRETCQLLAERSTVIADGVRNGTLAIVGAEYALAEGRAPDPVVCAALFAALALATALPATAQIYKWKDANGVTQYSGTPPAGKKFETREQARSPQASAGAGTPAAPVPETRALPRLLTSKMPTRSRTAVCSATTPPPGYSIGISQPPKSAILASSATWRSWIGEVRRASLAVMPQTLPSRHTG